MELIRLKIEELIQWKDRNDRKPLIVHGARQVGKTWLMLKFGRDYFEDTAYFNFDENRDLASIFYDMNPLRILKELSYQHGSAITPGRTLVVFDEIQECNNALNSLKYFCEQMPQQSIICAGSLLGVAVSAGHSFPVGKVNHIHLRPLTFLEYLYSADEPMYRYVQDITEVSPLPDIFFNRIMSQFRSYLVCGGMPVAVKKMIETNDIAQVDTVLQDILNDYILDFTKHATPQLSARISHVWHSVPSQLSKENRKFIYQLIRPGARAREYEDALIWLQKAGLLTEVKLNKKPALPLSAYDDLSSFKIYLSDIGLLRMLAHLPAAAILNNNSMYTEFKGAYIENYIQNSLTTQFNVPLRYWTSDRAAEVDFILQTDKDVIPIEVKSNNNVRGRSLQVYNKTYSPSLCLRFSTLNLDRSGNLLNIPLFLADKTRMMLDLIGC